MCVFVLGCGVKGRPLPPEEPVMMGNGQPTYLENQAELEEVTKPNKKSKKAELDK